MSPVDRADASVAVEVCRGHPGGMEGDADTARTAALFADPARVRVLLALGDGRALAASVLAAEARLSAQGVSAHLAKLRAAGLVVAEKSGRHRFYRLAGPDVLRPPRGPARGLERATPPHLAGALGAAVAARFAEAGWVRRRAEAHRALTLTPDGARALETHLGLADLAA
jgi:DNA-binding transcriptional ArsR family regulator